MSNREQALEVARRLRQAGHRALFAGGAVRDMVMGQQPRDVDVATDASSERVMSLFEHCVPVGARFGVVLVLPDGSVPVEVASFRSDASYSDHRHPDSVRAADEREDAARRDFTINGLFWDPFEEQLLDYVGGQRDIEQGIVRAIGDADARLDEDRLRMLRGVRFAARFSFRFERTTFEAIRRHAHSIASVSAERIRDELTRMLCEGAAAVAFELLDASGLLERLLPEVKALQGVEQPPLYHPEGDVWSHTMLMLEQLREPSPSLAWAALLHDIGKPPTQEFAADRIRFHGHDVVGAEMSERVLRRLRCSRELIEQVVAMVRDHLKFAALPQMRESTWKRFLRTPGFEEHLELHRLDCLASHGKLELWRLCQERLAALEPEQLKPQPLISGHDLIAEGYRPGPRFKTLLEAVEDAQLEGRISTREQALELLHERFPPGRER